MSLTVEDKNWIEDAIVTGTTEAIKPVLKELKSLKVIVKKNHPNDFK